MLAVLSPAKSLDMEAPALVQEATEPGLLDKTKVLVEQLQGCSAEDLQRMMGISDKLAQLNYDRYQRFSFPFTPKNAKQALFAFTGDVYTGLDAGSLSEEEVSYAQQQIRILSGLYGVLRPLDLMQAYRLEMGTKLATARGEDLYDFWDGKVTEQLNVALAEQKVAVVVNLASQEYAKVVRKEVLKGRFITVQFKQEKGGKYKVIGLLAKKARGKMARFIVQKKPQKVEDLQDFAEDGYCFAPGMSSEEELVFIRHS